STATPIMIGLLGRCFPKQFSGWESKLKEIIPSYGVKLNENPSLYAEVRAETDRLLKLA
ncbi:MAG: malate:quinone oxidoreductase, partial [Paeniglutamicibacter sp.]